MNDHDSLSPLSLSSPEELLEIKSRITQSYNEANTILKSIPDGILLISQEGEILICNSQAKEILGIPEDLDILKQPFSNVFPDTFFGFSLQQALDSFPVPKTLRLSLRHDAIEKEIELFVRRNESNGYLFIQIRNSSEYKQLESAIERYKNIAELGKMTATLAHEIRNPLTGIAGFASLLQEELSSPRHQRILASIISGTRSLNTLVSSMLEYTKSQPLNLKTIDLQELFSSLIPSLSVAYPSCIFTRDSSLPLLRSIDPDRILSAIWNLVKNAFEASESTITVSLLASGDISVSNPGELSTDVKEKLFTPFFTTKVHGHGLGLAEVQKTMRLHGGEVFVESKASMITFILKLPPS